MLIKSGQRKNLVLFAAASIVVLSYSALNAEMQSAGDKSADRDEVLTLALSQAQAEEGKRFPKRLEAIITEEKEEEVRQHIDSYIRYIPSRKADSQSGKIGIIESNGEYDYEFKLFGKLPVEFSLSQQYISIKNSTAVELPAHLVAVTGGLEFTLPFFAVDKTYLRLAVNPSFYADAWDFHSSSFRIPTQTLLIYQPDSRWTFIGGVAVYPDFKNIVLPIVGFIYKPNDRLVFNIIPRRPNISYSLNDRITLFAEGGTALNSEFEVNKDNLKNVILEYNENRLGAGVKYKFNKFIWSSVSCGAAFNRYLKYKDSLGKVVIKDAAYVEFRIVAAI